MSHTPGQQGFPQSFPPPRKSGNGLAIGVVIGAVIVVDAAGVGLWLVAGASKPGGSQASIKSPSTQEGRPTDDGAPATEVRIETIRMSSPASIDKGAAKCEYRARDNSPPNPDVQDVGSPGDGDKPDTGTQDMAIATNHGDLEVTVDNERAPCTVASFDFLSGKQFFDDTTCHRLTTSALFVLQCGDPSGTGKGGPDYMFDNEYEPEDTAEDQSEKEQQSGEAPEPNYPAGTVAMANAGESEEGGGTNGSQFFIVYKDTYLPPAYTIFGELTTGLDIVNDIAEAGAVAPVR